MAPLTLPRTRRLAHDLEFQAVYGARMKKVSGPVVVFSMPNRRGYHRLGLAVGKRVGNAPTRNRAKRLLREAFRHEQHETALVGSPAQGLDLVLSVRSAADLSLESVRGALRVACEESRRAWERRVRA